MLEFMRPFFTSRSEYKNNRTKELIKAYNWIRENNNSIPDDILNLISG